MTQLPSITHKQQYILKLLYKYRFLTRLHIQTLLHHKDYKTIYLWLKDLRAKEYIAWINGTDRIELNSPAVYYLSLNGLRWLRGRGEYPPDELHKRYQDNTRALSFRTRHLLLADCALSFMAKQTHETAYTIITPPDYYHPDNAYHFLRELAPQLCIIKQDTTATGVVYTSYLMESFDDSMPRRRIRKRLAAYVEYFTDNAWEDETGDAPPIVLLAYPTTSELIYAKKYTRTIQASAWNTMHTSFLFTTLKKLNEFEATGKIWEKV